MTLEAMMKNDALIASSKEVVRAVLTLSDGTKVPVTYRPRSGRDEQSEFDGHFSTTIDCLPKFASNWVKAKFKEVHQEVVKQAKRRKQKPLPKFTAPGDETRVLIATDQRIEGLPLLTVNQRLAIVFTRSDGYKNEVLRLSQIESIARL